MDWNVVNFLTMSRSFCVVVIGCMGSRPGGSAFRNVLEDKIIANFFGDVQIVLRGTCGRLCWRGCHGGQDYR